MRLFIAIELSDEVRAALQSLVEGLESRCAGVRWIPKEQWHVTVKFLGEVPDADVGAVREAVERAAREWPTFAMETSGCGCFPPRGGVRIVWAGVNEPTSGLLKGVTGVENEMEMLGFPREQRAFSPHITIGRVKEDASGGRIRKAVESGKLRGVSQSVKQLTLMSSVLGPKGSTYSAVTRAALGN